MTKPQQDLIFDVAYHIGIEVVFVKSRNEFRAIGVHLINPTVNQLVNGLLTALEHGYNTIYIYKKAL